MAEKRVVSIEDRIPKLKQERKRKSNRRLIIYLTVFFLLIALVVYLQSPLSHVKEITVTGHKWVTTEEIISLSEVSGQSNYWGVNSTKVSQSIEQHPQIESVKVVKNFPNQIHLEVEELKHVGYVLEGNNIYPILANGDLLEDIGWENVESTVPFIKGFQNNYLDELVDELDRLSPKVMALISEILWTPSEGNPYKVTLFMTDGYEVESTIRNLSSYLDSYPSIISQLDNNESGKIKIDEGGAVFTPYTIEEKQEEMMEGENEDS
ncbi:FtsQ-type POTRA domain-containing protein [Gracilibacillus sp. YIM 98692]|uniref:cell division protein FtsQ/DivIB n=1 Tax=Gracilibacillus sp. YIM 98692 TaxID=2663532 RepID=UPI0013D64368|nr:FtsQ-type POTRA domain-containing protein [Gracilibacillus sp. YIM 98692]